jgi:hypothetical protein
MDTRTNVRGKLEAGRVLRYIAQVRKAHAVVIERGKEDSSLFIATGACLLRLPESRHFAPYLGDGVQCVSLSAKASTPASPTYGASWQQYMDQFADESTVETLVPTRLLARVPQFAPKQKKTPQLSMYCQLCGKEEGGSIVWIKLEIADAFTPNPDDLGGFVWQLSATGLVRVAQVSGWCAVVRPDTPNVSLPPWQFSNGPFA